MIILGSRIASGVSLGDMVAFGSDEKRKNVVPSASASLLAQSVPCMGWFKDCDYDG